MRNLYDNKTISNLDIFSKEQAIEIKQIFQKILDKFYFDKQHRVDTKKSYQKIVNLLIKYYPYISSEKLTREQVIFWRNDLLQSIKNTSWNTYSRHCHAIFNFAIEYHLVNRLDNPFSKTQVRKEKSQHKLIPQVQLQYLDKLLITPDLYITIIPNYLQPWWFTLAILHILRFTAIRRSQLLKLKISNIDLSQKTIFISEEINKNHNYYIIPINKKLHPHLERLIVEHRKSNSNKNSQLFNINLFSESTRNKNKIMTTDQLTHLFRVLSKHLNFKLSPHRFRHTIATQLMRKPQNVYITQKLLGHKNIQTTLCYIEYDIDMIRKHVEKL
ncbi:Site-specific recombinase XerD [Pasteurella testudinis DSM 23072]|uniref:Site-specific recombinase XerD n=1 Tax=Pasteurella testudinis DSM 23072 TaxID=1122938 RepID=A0A1W1UN01_9PAST|nr:site-specific integrase [Pasteurella testudinis]SMB82472.1 Site-specific recombinase XerD [Pasteurella testudinis DSM 23072]SUB52196.1 tyrosine recombinase-1 family protein [Pasteurella testudinis]